MLQQSVIQSLMALTRKELKVLVATREQMKPQMKVHYQRAIPGTDLGRCNYRLWHTYKVEISKVDKKISKLVVLLKELKKEMTNRKAFKTWWETDLPYTDLYPEVVGLTFPNYPIYPNLNLNFRPNSGVDFCKF